MFEAMGNGILGRMSGVRGGLLRAFVHQKLAASPVEIRQLALPCSRGFVSAEGFLDSFPRMRYFSGIYALLGKK